MLLKKYPLKSILLSCVFLIHSVAFGAKDSEESQVAFKHAVELQKAARYEEAILEFQEIERLFPYSNFAKRSKLLLADIHYDMLNFVQAQFQYQHYYDLYPSDEKSDYALYRVGESLYKQMPKTVDRDLSLTGNILKIWRGVLVRFPNSKYSKLVLKRQTELINRLAKKELYVAEYYKKQKKFISAHRRYKGLFSQFPTFKKNKEALTGALEVAKQLDDGPLVKKYSEWISGL